LEGYRKKEGVNYCTVSTSNHLSSPWFVLLWHSWQLAFLGQNIANVTPSDNDEIRYVRITQPLARFYSPMRDGDRLTDW